MLQSETCPLNHSEEWGYSKPKAIVKPKQCSKYSMCLPSMKMQFHLCASFLANVFFPEPLKWKIHFYKKNRQNKTKHITQWRLCFHMIKTIKNLPLGLGPLSYALGKNKTLFNTILYLILPSIANMLLLVANYLQSHYTEFVSE